MPSNWPSPSSPEPEEISRLQAGDPTALTSLYLRVGKSLATLARRLTGSREDAEDVLHDVFLGLPEAMRHYEERGKLEAWLRLVTVRTALARMRAQRRRRGRMFDPHALPAKSPAPTIDSIALADALDELPAPLREVVVLKMIEGYSHSEIADLLGISSHASEQRLHRAVQFLRRRLDP